MTSTTGLEPDTAADTDDGHCLHSIAISLKRIADVVDGADTATLTFIVQQLAWEAGRSFQHGTRTDR